MTVLNHLVLGVAVLLMVESSLAFSPSALSCRFDTKTTNLRTVTEMFFCEVYHNGLINGCERKTVPDSYFELSRP